MERPMVIGHLWRPALTRSLALEVYDPVFRRVLDAAERGEIDGNPEDILAEAEMGDPIPSSSRPSWIQAIAELQQECRCASHG